LSLLSPLLVWRKHKKVMGKTLLHKFVAIHLPISFVYHALQGLCCYSRLLSIAKLLDYVCIHSYAMICASKGRCSRKPAMALNTCCVVYIVSCCDTIDKIDSFHITFFRMGSLVMSGKSFLSSLPHTHKKLRIKAICYGFACSSLFILDDQLLSCGHPLFHLLLGGLYACTFSISKVSEADKVRQAHSFIE
jgi:hypothetical protein